MHIYEHVQFCGIQQDMTGIGLAESINFLRCLSYF